MANFKHLEKYSEQDRPAFGMPRLECQNRGQQSADIHRTQLPVPYNHYIIGFAYAYNIYIWINGVQLPITIISWKWNELFDVSNTVI